MHRNKVGIFTLAAGIALGGCGDSTEPEMDPITEAEAAQLATFLMGQSFGAPGMPVGMQELPAMEPGSPLVAMARVDFDGTRTETANCPLGGSVEVTVTLDGFEDDETGVAELDATQTQVYRACSGQGESGDFTFTLDSAPSVTSDFFIGVDAQENVTAIGSIVGAVDWVAGERSGRCQIDFAFDLETEGQNVAMSASGRVCNVTLDQNLTVTS